MVRKLRLLGPLAMMITQLSNKSMVKSMRMKDSVYTNSDMRKIELRQAPRGIMLTSYCGKSIGQTLLN